MTARETDSAPLRARPPGRQGLYDPAFEHDACGVGFVVDIKGRKSHRILAQAIEVLRNLDHRGASGSEVNTGDGAGVLLQMPHRFLVGACEQAHIALPEPGHYGCATIFMPKSLAKRRKLEQRFQQIVQSEGQAFLGWRTVPTCNRSLGETALASEPVVRQASNASSMSSASAPTTRSAPRPSTAPSSGTSAACRSRRWSTRACCSPSS